MAQETWVWAAEKEILARILPDLFGYYCLQLGGTEDLLSASRIPYRWRLDGERAHLLAHFEALPVASDSVDVVVLPHTLERSGNPQGILQEVKRILVPEGHALILGFHPFSFSNIYLRRGLSAGKVKAWCIQLGLEVHQQIGLGGRIWPFPANLYLLRVKKRVAAITPIRPRWQARPSLGSIRQPAAKVING